MAHAAYRALRRTTILLTLGALAALIQACGGGTPSQPTPPPAPTLTCPANITEAGVIAGGKQIDYTAPIAAGGAPPVTVTCSPASGSTFATGTTTVACTATDARGRQAACSFTVTLDPLLVTIRRIVAFGDSVTAGEDGRRLWLRPGFVDPLRSFPALLQAALGRDFPGQDVQVFNEGVSGARAKEDVRRLRDVLDRHHPDVLVLLHGYNELLNDGVSGVTDVVGALRDQIRIAKDRDVARIFVSTLTPGRPSTGPFNRTIDPQAILQANGRIRPLATEEGALLIDAFAAFAGREDVLVTEDGLHLTPEGNQVLADTVYAAFRNAGITSGLR